MFRRPPGSTRTDTLFPSLTLFRSAQIDAGSAAQFPLESVSLIEIARDFVSLLAPGSIAEGKAITLDAGSGHPVARGRREAIAAALRNLHEKDRQSVE